MKSDTERKKYYTEKLHKRKSRMHVHLSKDLRSKLKIKKRAILLRKGDTVKVMRGPGKGKEAKVSDVNTVRRKVFVEGVLSKNARGKENPIPIEPSNLLLLSLEATKERKEIFSEEAFRRKEPKKEEKKPEQKGEQPKTSEPKIPEQKALEPKTPAVGSKVQESKPVEHRAQRIPPSGPQPPASPGPSMAPAHPPRPHAPGPNIAPRDQVPPGIASLMAKKPPVQDTNK